ncbi:Dip2/Utp12 family-domain-containing protein [Apodospora peruviana]|uniref:Dip2/Utp12 family-domain-containing protein n=1 Tax=Apodospora peruviana TaxID=516989 RepID=A0AAE0HSE6_9PEZI|nr:Dip2/Utp12 family-domain-containing protein [Apodospora peruviana]
MSTKRKPATALARPVIKQSAKTPSKTRIDESRTAVSIGLSQKTEEPIEISSDSSSHYSDLEDDASDDEAAAPATEQPKTTAPEVSKLKRDQDADVEMDSGDGQEQGDASDAEETSPTFGDLVRGNSTIDVSASLAAETVAQAPRSGAQSRSIAPINAVSMGITLEQALRTDDSDLLESCLQINNIETIEKTIQRMDSLLAGALLSKLAARMHRRPGRAYGLMKWVQWTLIAHGGALVGQPDVVKRLAELNRVLEERSRGLTSLLSLKGKLDMLDAQMRFRKSVRSGGSGRSRAGDEEESDEESDANVDEPGVVFVEGEENQIQVFTNRAAARAGADEEDDFPAMNGNDGDSDDDSEEDDEDFVGEDLADEESMDEDEVDHDDVEESGEEESDNEDSGPPAKVQKVSSKFPKRK